MGNIFVGTVMDVMLSGNSTCLLNKQIYLTGRPPGPVLYLLRFIYLLQHEGEWREREREREQHNKRNKFSALFDLIR